jgi:hypothetical protein
MPNVRSQRIDATGLEIVASDGRVYTLTKAEVIAFFQSTTGSAASRRAQVITSIKEGIVTTLGAEQIDILDLDYDFNPADGSITKTIIGRGL